MNGVSRCLENVCLETIEDQCTDGKENGVNILKLIDEGPFKMGTVQEKLAEGTEGAPYLDLNVNKMVSGDNTSGLPPQRVVDPTGSPSSTAIDQDIPSASTSPTTQEIQS
nr:hypothetical protein [Tanacetum cinerariifolium]